MDYEVGKNFEDVYKVLEEFDARLKALESQGCSLPKEEKTTKIIK